MPKVRLSGGPKRQRFELFGTIMSKATVAKILAPYGVEVVQHCKDCDFIAIPDAVNEPSKSAKLATHNNALTIKISKLMKMLVAQRHRLRASAKTAKKAKSVKRAKKANSTKRAKKSVTK